MCWSLGRNKIILKYYRNIYWELSSIYKLSTPNLLWLFPYISGIRLLWFQGLNFFTLMCSLVQGTWKRHCRQTYDCYVKYLLNSSQLAINTLACSILIEYIFDFAFILDIFPCPIILQTYLLFPFKLLCLRKLTYNKIPSSWYNIFQKLLPTDILKTVHCYL